MVQLIHISIDHQVLSAYGDDKPCFKFMVSTAANGAGEQKNSECTPRGWHAVHSVIGKEAVVNSVFVGRVFTGEVYSEALGTAFPERDWILTRIVRLEGLEPDKNKGGDVDSFERYIYIHGTPDTTVLGKPGSRGCIRMHNQHIIALADWVEPGCRVYIE